MDALRLVFGCDPGVSGALALQVQMANLSLVSEVYDLPVRLRKTGKKEIDAAQLAQLVRDLRARFPGAAELFCVEDVNAMPSREGRGMGATSAFQFGRGLGVIEGVVETLKIPLQKVQAQHWKRLWNLRGVDKDYARTVAIQRYPVAAGRLERKKDVGRAEALLIAGWALHQALGQGRAD